MKPLVAFPLTRDNYHNWAHLMTTAMKGKTKLGFFDGLIKISAPTSSTL